MAAQFCENTKTILKGWVEYMLYLYKTDFKKNKKQKRELTFFCCCIENRSKRDESGMGGFIVFQAKGNGRLH